MNQKHFHISGVCGTAMGSLAILLKNKGYKVTGSDTNIYPPMSTYLKNNQIQVTKGYDIKNLQPHPDIVVIGNVLSRGNSEVEYTLSSRLKYVSMSELLKEEFIRGNTSIVITGTHGKTGTTSLCAQVFEICEASPGFLIGGLAQNFGLSARAAKSDGYFITEGDEYDTCFFDKRSKFFHYLPDRLIINNIEFDHGDIFDSLIEIKQAFTLMLRQIPKEGCIFVNGDDPVALEVAKNGFSQIKSFGFGQKCDAIISNCKPWKEKPGMDFDLEIHGQVFSWRIPLMGEFNVRNATGVILLALEEGFSPNKIQKGLSTFKNTRRRLEELTSNKKIRLFDDFAHHPTSIYETLKALKSNFPSRKIHAIYEPRSNTSVRKFHQDKMLEAFEYADRVSIYKLHHENDIPQEDRLDLDKIIHEINQSNKPANRLRTLEAIMEYTLTSAEEGDLILIMSQGDFGGLPKKLAEKLDRQ